MLLLNTVYGILSVITWSAFFYKLRDLIRDWHNPQLRILCIAISGFAAPFAFASPWLYVRIDRWLGVANIATLFTYCAVAVAITGFLALLVSWSTTEDRIRLWHRLIVAYAMVTMASMIAFFSLGDVSDAEHPADFDVFYAETPYISEFLLAYQVLFTVGMVGLIRMCWRYSKVVDRPWLRRGLRTVTAGAVAGMGYCVPKVVSLLWDLFGTSPLDFVNSVVAPMFASVSAILFAVGFTMPAWGVGIDRTRHWLFLYRAYTQMHPMWVAMTAEFPDVVLLPSMLPSPREIRWTRHNAKRLLGKLVIEVRDGKLALRPHDDPEVAHTVGDLRLLVTRQTVEVRDVQMLLSGYYCEVTADRAREKGQERQKSGDDLDAIIEAARIAAALYLKALGAAPIPEVALHDHNSRDAREEGEWLIKVADAYQNSPIVPAALSGIENCDRALAAVR